MMFAASGSTLHNVMTRLTHFRIGGLVSRTQNWPSPFLTKDSSRSSYSLVISTEMMPSVTTVEQDPVTGRPHSLSLVIRIRGILKGVKQCELTSSYPPSPPRPGTSHTGPTVRPGPPGPCPDPGCRS